MLKIVIRKILYNRWISVSLLICCTLAIAVAGAIPMYSYSVINNSISNEFEDMITYGEEIGMTYQFEVNFEYVEEEQLSIYQLYDEQVKNSLSKKIHAEIITNYNEISSVKYKTKNIENTNEITIISKDVFQIPSGYGDVYISAVENFTDLVEISQGRMYQANDEYLEVVATDAFMRQNNFELNGIYETYFLDDEIINGKTFKIVGIIIDKDTTNGYLNLTNQQVYADIDILKSNFENNESLKIGVVSWFYIYDFYTFQLYDVPKTAKGLAENEQWIDENYGYLSHQNNFNHLIAKFEDNVKNTSLIVIMLIIPIIFMIALYISMITNLLINNEKNEIATMKSRGATRKHIIKIYFYNSFIISVVSYFLGILLAIFICKLLGASNGFLEFISRDDIVIKVTWKVFLYAFIALGFFNISMLIPVIRYSKYDIIQLKADELLIKHKPFWEKMYIDIILLAISIYSIINYQSFRTLITLTSEQASYYPIFIAASFFMLGSCMLFARIYPFMMKLFSFVGKRSKKVTLYSSLLFAERGDKIRQTVMIFLMFAVCIGIFNANSARSINANLIDEIKHNNQSDIIFKPIDYIVRPTEQRISDMLAIAIFQDTGIRPPYNGEYYYLKVYEKVMTLGILQNQRRLFEGLNDYENFTVVTPLLQSQGISNLPVEKEIPRYFYSSSTATDTKLVENPENIDIQILGVNPEEYSQAVWYRENVNDHPLNYYLSLLITYRNGMIISRNLAEEKNLELGDTYRIYLKDNERPIDLLVLEIVDYWPGYTSNSSYNKVLDEYIKDSDNIMGLCVIDYNFLVSFTGENDLEFIAKKKEDIKDSEVIRYMIDNNLGVLDSHFTDYEIESMKKEVSTYTMNSTLTLNFIISLIICAIGFIIFWSISIKKRELQFGILRSLGISKRELIIIILGEQAWVFFIAIIAAIPIGSLASNIFIPIYSFINEENMMMLDFIMEKDPIDYISIYGMLIIMITAGIFIIKSIINKLRMDQAIKLGED